MSVVAVEFRSEVESLQDTYDIFIRNADSEDTVNLLNAYGKLSGLDRIACVDIERSPADLAAAEFFDKVESSLHCHYSCVFINTLGESH